MDKPHLSQPDNYYKDLIAQFDQGYILVEVLFDENDQPCDIRYIEANAAASRMMGGDLTGKHIRGLDLNYGQHWYGLLGRIAKTGVPETHEVSAGPLGIYYRFHAFRVGLPDERKIAMIYDDISVHKRAEIALAESEEKYRSESARLQATLKSMGDAVYIGDTSGITLANQAALDQLGYSGYDELNKNIGILAKQIETRDAISHEVITTENQAFARALRGEHVVQNVRVKHIKTGEERIIRSSASPVIVNGRIVSAVAVNTDITEQWETVEAERSNEEIQSFLLKLSDIIRPLKDTGKIQKAAMKLLAEKLDVMRATYFEVEPDQDWFRLTARFERNPVPIPERLRLSDFSAELSRDYRSGLTLLVCDTEKEAKLESQREAYRAIGIRAWASVPLVKNGHLLAIVGVHSTTPRDWTNTEVQILENLAERTWAAVERARAEAALNAAELQKKVQDMETEQQREIFRASLSTLEEERHRISESLHNGVGQILYGIKLSVGDLKQELSEEEFRKATIYTNKLIGDAIMETRRVSHELMPATLEQFGLKSAVEDICTQLSGEVKFTCIVRLPKKRLEKYLELAIYRTVQELMINIVKHAQATAARTEIGVNNEAVNIRVSDNGRGMEEKNKTVPGIGLVSIRSKIKLLNGEVQIESSKSEGTTVKVRIPIARMV